MGNIVNPKEVRGYGGIYWKEIFHKQLSGATTGKWMFGCSTNLNRPGVVLLKKNLKRSLIHIISDLESEEVVDSMSKRVKVYWGNMFFRDKERVKSGTYNFVVEYPSVFHRGEILP